MTYDELIARMYSAVRAHDLNDTPTRLLNLPGLSLHISHADWRDVIRTAPATYPQIFSVNEALGIPVERDSSTEDGKPRIVSHWEVML